MSWIGHFFSTHCLLALAIGYLLGSIPFGLILTRMAGLGDIRSIGSGNIGATNVLRTGNKSVAAATLVLDALKGAAAVFAARKFIGGTPVEAFYFYAPMVAALGAVLGHCFPVWLKFKGGKGVATTLGGLLALAWPFGIAACVLWLLFAVLFRISSLSALLALATTALLAWITSLLSAIPASIGRHTSWPFALTVTVIAALVIAMHHENIRRLLAGTESKIGAKN